METGSISAEQKTEKKFKNKIEIQFSSAIKHREILKYSISLTKLINF